jgi:hypothetical protein
VFYYTITTTKILIQSINRLVNTEKKTSMRRGLEIGLHWFPVSWPSRRQARRRCEPMSSGSPLPLCVPILGGEMVLFIIPMDSTSRGGKLAIAQSATHFSVFPLLSPIFLRSSLGDAWRRSRRRWWERDRHRSRTLVHGSPVEGDVDSGAPVNRAERRRPQLSAKTRRRG